MNRRAFTLIELLVVISIIALLSSVVLASLNSAREKGRIGAGKYFAAEVDHTAGDQAVGIWNFDECSSTSTADISGFGNNGAGTNSPTPSADTPSGTGCSMSFGGTNQVITVPYSTTLLANSAITLAAWVKLNTYTAGGVTPDRSGIIIRASSYYLTVSTSGTLDAYFAGVVGAHTPSNSIVPLNKWVFLTITYDGANVKWYIDGRLDKTLAATGSISPASPNPLQIGAEAGQSRYTNGYIDSARVFMKDLSASEIGRLYALEAPKHFAAER